MRCHNQPPDVCGFLGEGDRVALPTLLPRPPVCLLGFHSLPVCDPFFLSPSKGPALSCPFGRSPIGWAWLRDAPSLLRGSTKCPPSQVAWPRCPRPWPPQHLASHSPRNPASRSGPLSIGLWGLGGPSRPFSTFSGTSYASKTVSSPWPGQGAVESTAELISSDVRSPNCP